jgi:hypothetical protein
MNDNYNTAFGFDDIPDSNLDANIDDSVLGRYAERAYYRKYNELIKETSCKKMTLEEIERMSRQYAAICVRNLILD